MSFGSVNGVYKTEWMSTLVIDCYVSFNAVLQYCFNSFYVAEKYINGHIIEGNPGTSINPRPPLTQGV
ncbi:hypothetical protein SDC9_154754 [bioreactor metagenome]|uniref:Uncharacterized protein n=1 Tax=bioreactor metagenome TaxID=1076179 RepID=A0A645F4E6_9ZZZZ